MGQRIMPSIKDVADMISILTNVEAEAHHLSEPWQFDSELFYVGTYSVSDGGIRVLILMDLPLSASVAALLLRFMPGEAEEAIHSKELNETLLMNLQEIFNILTGKLNTEDAEHLVFKNIYSNSNMPEAIQLLLNNKSCQRADYHFDIPNYFPGKIALLMFD